MGHRLCISVRRIYCGTRGSIPDGSRPVAGEVFGALVHSHSAVARGVSYPPVGAIIGLVIIGYLDVVLSGRWR